MKLRRGVGVAEDGQIRMDFEKGGWKLSPERALEQVAKLLGFLCTADQQKDAAGLKDIGHTDGETKCGLGAGVTEHRMIEGRCTQAREVRGWLK